MTDISFLLEKIDGQKLSADEFKALVTACMENQIQAVEVPYKIGWALRKTVAGKNTLHLFKDRDTAESWEAEPTEENAPIVSVDLPSGGGGGTYSYVVKLETNSAQEIESSNRNQSVNIRFTSVVYNSIDGTITDTGEDATVEIQRQVAGSSEWETVALLNNFASVAANTGAYTTIDLSNYLVNGEQTLRFIAYGAVSELATTYLTFNIQIAEMDLAFTGNWGEAYVYNEDVNSTHVMNVPLRITGNVHKFLYWELIDPQGVKQDEGSIEIGTNEYTETSYQGLNIDHPQLVGIYKVRARLRYGNSSVYTSWIEQNIMVSVKDDTTVLLCVNNVTVNVYNWSSQRLMDYAVYNPNTLTTSTVKFEIKDNDEAITWMTNSNADVVNGTVYDYTPYLSIENSTPSGRVRLFAAKVKVSVDNVLMQTLTYSIDNSNDFAPTAGANFILMPSSRSNNDSDKDKIHNESSVSGEPTTINATWENVVFEDDGWVTDENGIKVLRLFAGSKVTIPYEAYSNTSQSNGLTIEVDLKSKNISDEDTPMFKMGKEVNGQFVGLILYPKRGYFFKSTNNVEWFQDIEWGENRRTHIAVNIIPRLSVGGRTINLVRMTVNANINREFTYLLTDRFWDGVSSGGIQIGCADADTYIYGMRIFKEKMLSSSDLFNDRVASVSDVQTKLALIEANNIMEGGVIKYSLAREKYNTLVWKGIYPSKLNQVETTGDLEINIVGDAAHSGTLQGMNCKGQGTSSKRYLYWNATWSFGDNGVWIDGNGTRKGKYHQLTATSPKAKKNVGKLNWASSMQSHKMGMCDMYNVLYNAIFDGSAGFDPSGIRSIEGYENTRVAVEEKPFLFFVQEDPSSEPVFYGNMTWGSAKGDKPTFGYDSSHPVLKDYLMIEGSDQTPVLGLCQVPWFDDEVTVSYDDEGEIEGWQYNGTLSFDLTLGNAASISHFKEAFNQCFYYSTRIKYYNGRLDDLQNDENADKSYQYFIVGQTYDNFKVYRYDWITSRWVNAGITKTGGVPDEVNVNTQLGLSLDPTSADFEGMLAAVKAARIAAFRAIAGNYFHVNDTLYGMQFNKINALSDNRNKNTYPYYDPVSGLIRFASDDNDTALQNNNQGQKQKPYWVEEHDFDSRSTFNNYFWAASGNAMYNLFEDAYPTELRTMMRKIMTKMADLGVGYGEGGIMGFYEKYLFSIQRYFPTVAYNECARLWYEYAKTLYDAGIYTNDTDPITQSMGDLLECEIEWVRQRIIYIASYCMYDAALGGSIEFRQLNSATYTLKPAIKMYVYMELGTSFRYPTGYNVPKRCEAGESVSIVCEGSDSIQTYIVGAEYLQDLGDLSPVGVTGSTAFANGRRLERLKLGDSNASNVNFKPNAVVSFPQNAEVIDLRNMGDALTSIGSLADCSKLQKFYCSGTGLTSVVLPQTNNLDTVVLPDGLQSLVLRNQQNINSFSYTPTSLRTLVTGKCNVIDQQFIADWVDSLDGDLSGYSLDMDGIRWTGYAATRLVKLVGFGHLVLKGKITMDSNSISAEQLVTVYNKLGALIDNGDLELVYTNVISLLMSKTSVTGGDEASISNFTVSALNANSLSLQYSEDGETWLPMSENPRLTMTSRTEVVNGCRYVYGTLMADDEVTAAVQYRVRATDGEQTSLTMYFSIITKNRIQAVTVNGMKYLTETNHNYPFSASLTPSNASEVPTYNWIIESVGDSDTYEVEVTQLYSRVVRRSDSAVMVELPNVNAASVNLATGNELMAAKNNNTSFTVRCTVRGTYGTEVSAAYEVIGHAQFVPRAVQSYDSEEENYNPALIIYLKTNESTLGISDKIEAAPDSGKGYYISQTNAALITSFGTINGLTQVQDSNGYCVESWEDGVLNPNSYYRFEDFDQFKYFTSITTLPTISSCSYVKYITIHNTCTSLGYSNNIPGSLLRLIIQEGNNCQCAYDGEAFRQVPANQCDLYLPSTLSYPTNIYYNLLYRFKPKAVYFNGTIDEWIDKNYIGDPSSINNYDTGNDNLGGPYPYDLYCKNELITSVTAEQLYASRNTRALTRCKSLVSIVGNVTSLSSYQLANCSNLENITFGDITEFPSKCFYKCSKIKVTTIPSTITTIGANAFSGSGASFTEIPDSVTTFGDQENMSNITVISYPNTMASPGYILGDNLQSIFFRKNEGESWNITTFPYILGESASGKWRNLKKIGFTGGIFVDGVFDLRIFSYTRDYYWINNYNRGPNSYLDVILTNFISMYNAQFTNAYMRFIKLLNIVNGVELNVSRCTYLYFDDTITTRFNGGGIYDCDNVFLKAQYPPTITVAHLIQRLTKVIIPLTSKSDYLQATNWDYAYDSFIEYNYTLDPANIVAAVQESEIVTTGIPLANCGISVNGTTATITCTDSTFTSAIPIKLHYRINGGAWSAAVNSGATFAVSANDVIEVYATHSLRAPSNMLKATWDGTDITYDYTDIYIDPNDVDSNGNLI